MKDRITSDKIGYHPTLGVHKTYKGFKWQPGYNEVSFVRPGKDDFETIYCTVTEFFKMIDKGEL